MHKSQWLFRQLSKELQDGQEARMRADDVRASLAGRSSELSVGARKRGSRTGRRRSARPWRPFHAAAKRRSRRNLRRRPCSCRAAYSCSGVRFAARVCNNHRRRFSIVNSTSCTSRKAPSSLASAARSCVDTAGSRVASVSPASCRAGLFQVANPQVLRS
jgi:hypothetical protein